MNRAAEETRHILGTGERGGDPSPWTAYGVSVGIEAAVRHRLGRDSLAGATVAVQGAGSVGYKLCDRLAFRGAKLIVTDVSPEAALRAGAAFDATSGRAGGNLRREGGRVRALRARRRDRRPHGGGGCAAR